MSKSIQVAIKVRPLLHREKGMPQSWRVVDNSIQLVESQAEPFYFDHIFDQNDSNEVVFDKMAKHIVHSSIQGFNGTIFAYGQTSSGKTYTMMGDAVNPGVMVLAAKELFKEIENANDRQFVLRVGYIEIYNEKIFDLLNKKNQDLKIHETPTGIVNVNCEESIITCEDDLLHHLCMGNKERTVGETNMNERSSRSHAIFRIIIESRKMDHSDDDAITQSVLNLVDLAGSERADQTGARGARLKEGGHINKSLLFLSNVIKRLSESEDDKYISYRDSKLTRILQASLGGNALTSIICTIKPTAIEETQSTLSFATRAKSIKNKPQVNEIVSDATMMKRLEREIHELKSCLAEERRKNESQIKVGQLEARIKNEVLKIINCNSLNDIRTKQMELRRRTWCPATNKQPHTPLFPSRIPEIAVSNPKKGVAKQQSLDKHPYLTVRHHNIADISPPDIGFTSQSSVKSDDEHFTPGEEWAQSPPKNVTLRTVSITPKADLKVKLRSIECAFTELQEFTNLEKNLDVRHEVYEALEQKCNALEGRNAALELERTQCLLVKDENDALKLELKATEDRCFDLQLQINQLTALNQAANAKASKYENEVAVLKQSINKLEVENRESVSLEFEYKSHKNKSKRRETELLELLAEKDREITKLERSLKSMSEERARSCREELLDISRHSNPDDVGNVCVKCEDLQTILAENEKVRMEFEKLTVAYDQLQLNYQLAQKEALSRQNNLDELRRMHQHDDADCDQLRKEIAVLRAKLEEVQLEFTSQGCDKDDKTEECEELKEITEQARQELAVLQQKYNLLEQTSLSQQDALSSIQADYDAIQMKYTKLQLQYAQLEESSAQSLANCERLQSANEALQSEITALKQRLEDLQQKLHQPNELTDYKTENIKLESELHELRTQFNVLQAEHDDLSSQLMDSLQENDSLRDQFNKLEQKMKTLEVTNASSSQSNEPALPAGYNMERYLLDSVYNTPESLQSSGVGMDEEVKSKTYADLLKRFFYLVSSLVEVELEDLWGKRRVFKAISTDDSVAPPCKLYIRNIQEVVSTTEDTEVGDLNGYSGRVYMQGYLKRHIFSIIAVEQDTDVPNRANNEVTPAKNSESDTVNVLKANVEELKAQLHDMYEEKKALISSTESTVNELREQINRLSAELFEKSLSVEKCTCSEYQKQIECLERERAEITLVCQELQERVLSSTCVDDTHNKTLCEEDMIEKSVEQEPVDYKGLVEQLKATNAALRAKIQLQESDNEKLKSLQELGNELHAAAKQRDELKEKNNLLQLEICQKNDMHENENRETFRKFKCELESKQQEMNELETQLMDIQNELEIKTQELNKTREELLTQTTIVRQFEIQVRQLEELNAACNCLALRNEVELKNHELQVKQQELELKTETIKNLTIQLESLQIEHQVNLKHSTQNAQETTRENTPEKTSEAHEMEKTIATLHDLQEDVIKERSALEAELSTVKAELTKLHEQIAELKSANSEMLGSISAYADLENQLNAELNNVKEKNSQNIGELHAAKERIYEIIQDFKNECVQITIKLQKSENGAQVITKTENMGDTTWEGLWGDLTAAKEIHTDKLEELLVTFEGLKCEKAELETKYSRVNMELQHLKAEKDDLETKLEAKRTELESQLMAEKVECESKLKVEKTFMETKLQAVTTELETKLQVVTKELETKLQAVTTELETKLAALADEKTDLEGKYIKALSQLERFAVEKHDVTIKLEQIKEEKVNIECSIEAVLAHLEQLKAEKVALESNLMPQLDQLKTEKAEVEHRLTDILSELEKLKKEKTDFESNLAAATESAQTDCRLAELQARYEFLVKENIELEKKYSLVSEELQHLKTEKIQLETKHRNERNKLDAELKRLTVEKTTLESKQSTFLAQMEQFETEKCDLELKLLTVKPQLDQFRAEKAHADSELSLLMPQFQQLKTEKLDLESKLTAEKNAFDRLKVQKSDLEIKLASMLKDLEAATSELQGLKKENISLKAELQAERTALCQLKTQKLDLESKLTAVTSTQKVVETEKSVLDRLKVEKSDLELKLSLMLKDIEAAKPELERLKTENVSLKTELQAERTSLDRLKIEKSDLESKLTAATSILNELETEKAVSNRLKVEKSDLELKLSSMLKDLEAAKPELERLKTEIVCLKTELQVERTALDKLKTEKLDLETKLTAATLALTNIEKSKTELERNLDTSKTELQQLKTENFDLKSKIQSERTKLDRLNAERSLLESKLVTATSTLKGYEKEKTELKQLKTEKTAFDAKLQVQKTSFERLKTEKSALEGKFTTATSTVKRLQTEKIELESKLSTALSQLQSHSNELQSQLKHWKEEKYVLETKAAEVQTEIDDYKTKLEQQQGMLVKLRTEKTVLESKIIKSPDVVAECAPLRAELEALRTENDDLKSRLVRTIEEAAKCSRNLQNDVQYHKKLLDQQTDAYKSARNSLDKKEPKYREDKVRLEGTIACLVSEKSALEEKLYATEMTVKRFESELSALHKMADSSGNSLDLNSSNSPRKAKAKERLSGEFLSLKSKNNFVEEKSTERYSKNTQIERKNRRLSTHDERRRQSFWGATRDAGTLTDPVDKNCNCLELDNKLKECEENLFIRESQVTALNMELKNHPLKTENATLLKKLQDEQNKHRQEIKKYKQLIVDQTTKAAQAAQAYASEHTTSTETQTESELEQSLQTLQGKYNDLKKICRSRYNIITKLEEQLAQKENAAIDANFSAYEAGQLKALKSECETLKRQLPIVQKKYDDAKTVLLMRRQEIDRLNAELTALRES